MRSGIPALTFLIGIAIGSLVHFGAPSAAAQSMGSMHAGMSAPAMSMQAAMTKMDAAMRQTHMTGNVDRDFMMMMIPHHQSAIDMARVELKYGRRPAVKAMAHDIIASQSKEISQMRAWLTQ